MTDIEYSIRTYIDLLKENVTFKSNGTICHDTEKMYLLNLPYLIN